MPDRPPCHAEYTKTWIQELTLRSEFETLGLKLFPHGCLLGGISKHSQANGLCSLQDSVGLGIPTSFMSLKPLAEPGLQP